MRVPARAWYGIFAFAFNGSEMQRYFDVDKLTRFMEEAQFFQKQFGTAYVAGLAHT